ncbi:hemicentin-2-like [Colossoma macropomum]|uniref:hemicentin-2-like n=1 Tax=Colossoma macropomum TaxID=42526 RepID=UPI001863F765|nr:hemicentin-2-like [Colossoma macropomum]
MAARALSCTLTLLVCSGVCLSQDLVLPARLIGAVGGNVTFDPVSLPPPPYNLVSWSSKEMVIITALGDAVSVVPAYRGRVSLDINTVALELRTLRMDDAGAYTLSINGETDTYTAETTLDVFDVDIGQSLVLPARLDGEVGENMVFRPTRLPSDTYDVITWRFGGASGRIVIRVTDGTVSTPRPEYSDRVSLDTNTLALELRNLTMDDAGLYVLIIDGNTASYTAETTLEVFEKVSGAVLIGPTAPVIEGNSADLTCDASGTIITTEWMKDNQKLSPSNNIIFSADNRSVSIKSVSRTDDGEYRCTLSNPVSSVTAVFTMTVNYGPDNVRIDGPSEVEEGGSVEFRCSADSVPEPRYTWTFDGTNTGDTTASFTVKQVNFSNSGIYTCTARNNVTGHETSASHTLAVKEKGSVSGGGAPLSAGAIAGIVIGVLLGVALVAGLTVYFTKCAGRPNSSSRGVKQNGATQSGGEQEHHYEDVLYFKNIQPSRTHKQESVYENTKRPSVVCSHSSDLSARAEETVCPSVVMAARALSCTLTLLVCSGVCLSQDLLLPTSLNGAVGGNVTFDPITIPPPPRDPISWSIGGSTIITAVGGTVTVWPVYTGRASMDINTLALVLSNLSMADAGGYTLTVNARSKQTTLAVFEPVSNITVTQNETELVEFNRTVRLACSASGSSLSFSWLNGSSEVKVGGRVQLTNGNRTLTITSVSRDDTGPYRCEASNVISNETSRPLTLTIYYGPDSVSVKAEPLKTIYSSGSDLTLTCSAESSPAAEFQWAVNGAVLSTEGPELKLTNIQTSQSGSFTCTAHNSKTLRYSTSEPTHITVMEKVSGAVLIGPTAPIIEGNSANLTCNASGTIITTEWMKDNQKLSPSNNIIFSADNRSVSIRSVSRTDDGEYRCTLSNPVSSDTAVFTMTVNYGPDTVRIDGPSEVEEGGSLNFRCSAESVPDPRYTWTFSGTNTGVTTASFTVKQVNFSNSGIYTCTARNNVTGREASASHTLAVKEIGSLSGGGGSLSGGAIAGIVIGVLLGVALVSGLIVYFTKFAGRPNSSSRGVKQNGATQSGGEQEHHYEDVLYFKNIHPSRTHKQEPEYENTKRLS